MSVPSSRAVTAGWRSLSPCSSQPKHHVGLFQSCFGWTIMMLTTPTDVTPNLPPPPDLLMKRLTFFLQVPLRQVPHLSLPSPACEPEWAWMVPHAQLCQVHNDYCHHLLAPCLVFDSHYLPQHSQPPREVSVIICLLLPGIAILRGEVPSQRSLPVCRGGQPRSASFRSVFSTEAYFLFHSDASALDLLLPSPPYPIACLHPY